MRIIVPALLAIFWVLPAQAQFDADSAGYSLNSALKTGVPVPAPSQTSVTPSGRGSAAKELSPSELKEWTVMVFINAKNNLELAGLNNVNEMEKVGSTKDLNIVVEMGRMKGQKGDTALDGDWTGTRRYLIKKDSNPEKIKSPVLESSPKADQGDYKQVVDFVNWSKAKFPAKRYMLVIWNHGSGFLDPRKEQKGISFDDETGNYIRTPQIGQILREAGKVDVLAFDACLMQMPEVAFEVKDNAEVVVGPEEVVPGQGYPYGLFLGAMAAKPEMNAEEAGAAIVDAFGKFYRATNKGVQLSAIRTSKLDGLAALISDFARLVMETGDRKALKSAKKTVIRYDVLGAATDPTYQISFYGDLSNFAYRLNVYLDKSTAKAKELELKSAELQDFIDKELVIRNVTSSCNRTGQLLSESKGISVYLPPVESLIDQDRLEGVFEGKYTDFAFDKATGWHKFVTYMFNMGIADMADLVNEALRPAAEKTGDTRAGRHY